MVRSWLVPLLLAIVFLASQPTSILAAEIGSFDATRGGPYSLANGAFTVPLRTILSANFPDTNYHSTGTLTPAFLAPLDMVVVTIGYSDSQAVTPLSASEQAALVAFVQAGGNALILGERNDFGAATNQSLMNPFGLNIVGATFADPNATVLNPLSVPFTAGPFGVVPSIGTTNPGWFDNVGLATIVATLDSNDAPLLAYFPENTMNPGSGRVIFSADSDIYTTNLPLILNSFAYLTVPEPSTVVFAAIGLGAVGLCGFRRRRSAS